MQTTESRLQLKVAVLIGQCKQRESLHVALLRLAMHQADREEQSCLSPTTIRWPIAEVEEGEGEETRMSLRLQSRNPLYVAAARRLIPFFVRRAGREVLTWRIATLQPATKSSQRLKILRALNLMAKRKLLFAWLSWTNSLPTTAEEVEESVITVRRQVVVERISYLRSTEKSSSSLGLFRRTLLGLQLRQKGQKIKAFTLLRIPKTVKTPAKDNSLDILKRLFVSTGLREKLTLLRAFWAFLPPAVVIKTMDPTVVQSIKAFENLFNHLVATRSLGPVFTTLRQKEAPASLESPELSGEIPPIDLPSISPIMPSISPSKNSNRLGYFNKKLWKLFRLRMKWGWKALSAGNPKTQRRRFYRIQKGFKALYSASILRRLNETWDLLKFLLYMKGKKAQKLKRLPLFAYPSSSVLTCQRLIRGFLGRKQVRGLRKHLLETPEAMVARYQISLKSVILIQRYVRGFTQRRFAAKLREMRANRPVLKGQVLSSRLIILSKALQKPIKRIQTQVLPRLAVRNKRAQVKRCIKLQKAAKEMHKLMQALAFRVIQAGSS
jgi:hypothetical protein